MKKSTNKELRRVLKITNCLLPLLDQLRRGVILSEFHRSLVWLGVSDLAYNLAKKHYNEPQKTGMRGQWYNPYNGDEYEMHINRVLIIIQFFIESDHNTPIEGVMYSVHKRFPWIELVTEMKTLGVEYLEDKTVTQKINSNVTQFIIKGNKIYRRLHNEFKRIPTLDEIVVQYVTDKLDKCETISFTNIKRFSERYRHYLEAKAQCSALSFDETYYESQCDDSVHSS